MVFYNIALMISYLLSPIVLQRPYKIFTNYPFLRQVKSDPVILPRVHSQRNGRPSKFTF